MVCLGGFAIQERFLRRKSEVTKIAVYKPYVARVPDLRGNNRRLDV